MTGTDTTTTPETTAREWALLGLSVLLSLALGLALIRWLAPGLLGVPVDLQVVQVDERLVPFYENVFRPEDFASRDPILRDPFVGVRLKPLLPDRGGHGPTDLLGFRNEAVPQRADVVVIGDSQTYGTNAAFDDTWPRELARLLPGRPSVYSMAVGGWGAAQYLDMFTKARAFRPRVVVVAFYAGNDSRESFRMAYHNAEWAFLRLDAGLAEVGLPPVAFPVPKDELWRAPLGGGSMVFTPRLRLASNKAHPGVEAGWRIMANVARRIANTGPGYALTPVFAVIPTKERVYAERLRREGVALDPDFAELARAEARNAAQLVFRISEGGGRVVDLAPALSRAALARDDLYFRGADGHPRAPGHRVIAEAVARALAGLLGDGEDEAGRGE